MKFVDISISWKASNIVGNNSKGFERGDYTIA